ncbi:PD-(D/E)XK motif protein [Mycobacterium colombiense]|uniref:PD-(D/E)XK motif protein n=1 Tax=Mycobacterium colombiense TaxID=339268 RepID=UPI00155FBD75|nr:PD-(D/E)XK motif protein [Mycobacterium colombiense]
MTTLDRVTFHRTHLNGVDWFVLIVDARSAHFEAYSLIAAVVDDLRAGRPFHIATARALAAYRDLLALRGRLSEEKAIGLIGELLVLEHLVQTIDESTAVDAWVGPRSEEHDFVLHDLDAEVKTTLNERRSHVIGSENQLQPSRARPLWLVSIQLTRAGAATDGFALTDVVHRVLVALTTTTSIVAAHLRRVGWHEDDADLYTEKYIWRSSPAAYLVDRRFPAVTRRLLDEGLVRPELVGHVTYRVDITDLGAGIPPEPIGSFVDSEE